MTQTTKQTSKLPPIPEPHPTLSITAEVILDHDFDQYSNGNMRMTLDRVDVSSDGEKVGHVAHVMPTGIVAKVGSRSYFLSPLALWNAIEEAEARLATPDTTNNEYALPDDALRHLPLLLEAAKGIVNVYTWRGSKGYTAALKEGIAELQAALKPFTAPTTNEAQQ